jgi:hypothetical protein
MDVAVELLAVSVRLLKVTGSNIDPEAHYYDLVLCDFPQFLLTNWGKNLKLHQNLLLIFYCSLIVLIILTLLYVIR